MFDSRRKGTSIINHKVRKIFKKDKHSKHQPEKIPEAKTRKIRATKLNRDRMNTTKRIKEIT